jgi:hypothetical protein
MTNRHDIKIRMNLTDGQVLQTANLATYLRYNFPYYIYFLPYHFLSFFYKLFPFVEKYKLFPSIEHIYFNYIKKDPPPLYGNKQKSKRLKITKLQIISQKKFEHFLNSNILVILSKYSFDNFHVLNGDIYYLKYPKLNNYIFTEKHLDMIEKYYNDNNFIVSFFIFDSYEEIYDRMI